ncbi:hypothetical protein DL768_008175 [Monosporascus sp. mg162]|nr:hypothetical protein DL768_008175 [Monosporascus sp. mg162]
MAATRRGQPELRVRLPSVSQAPILPDVPPISALFLIEFDVKAGYTVSWKAGQPGIELEGEVEYKSLPSGLHTVSDDLIYFVHDRYAGLSAFVNAPVEDSDVRNARMLAVGVLVPLSYGRLGRAWKHVEGLKELASRLAANAKETNLLEEYWEKHQARDIYDISIVSNIPLPTVELLSPSSPPHRLKPLFTVGVHDIPFLMAGGKSSTNNTGAGWIACTTDSILATKDTLCDMLITMPGPHAAHAKERVWPTIECPRGVPVKATQRDLRRYRTLRTGLTRLQQQQQPPCTVSPTAQSSFSTATTVPDSSNKKGKKSEKTADEAYELTEDDERRIVEPLSWAALAYSGFMWWASAGEQGRSDEAQEAAYDAALLADLSSSSFPTFVPAASSALMNRNASAAPSAALSISVGSLAAAGQQQQQRQQQGPDEARVELAVITYFHRLTTGILGTLADVVNSGGSDGSDSDPDPGDDGDDDRGDESAVEDEDENEALLGGADNADDDGDQETRRGGRGIRIGSQAMADMGLDVWSGSDAAFVRELVERYFDHRAYVEGKGVESTEHQSRVLSVRNHEFYGLDYESGLDTARRLSEEPSLAGTLILLNRARWDDPGSSLTILGCTLWSAIPEEAYGAVESKVNDFRKIRKWTTQKHNEVHAEEAAWLRKQVAQVASQDGNAQRRLLVATHHAPCVEGTSRPEHSSNPWMPAFATDLVDQEGWGGVNTWVFGHTHYSTDLLRNGIWLVANQRGYVLPGSVAQREEGEKAKKIAHEFDAAMVITV